MFTFCVFLLRAIISIKHEKNRDNGSVLLFRLDRTRDPSYQLLSDHSLFSLLLCVCRVASTRPDGDAASHLLDKCLVPPLFFPSHFYWSRIFVLLLGNREQTIFQIRFFLPFSFLLKKK